jgi:histone deacetylase 6
MTIEEIKATWERFEHDSLFVNSSTALASRLSCGGVIAACEAVMTGRQGIRNAFAVVRPPGHHAEPDHAMGFCFLNNVAVAVNSVRRRLGVGKVMILDW